jgi:predicted PurR-regulated permease PerM
MPDAPSPPRTRPHAEVAPAETPGLGGLLALAIGVVVVAALYLAREVLIPVTLAVLLSFALAPLAGLLQRLRLGRVPSAVLAAAAALGLFLALGALIGTQLAQLARDVPRYQSTIERKVEIVRELTVGRISGLAESLGRGLERVADRATRDAPSTAGGEGGEGARAAAGARAGERPPARAEEPRPVPVEVRQPPPTPLELAERVLAPVVAPLAHTAVVFVVAVFALLQRQDLRDRLIRLFGSDDLHRTTVALDDAARRLSRYFLTQIGLNTAYAVVTGAVLMVIGVPGAVLWGVLAGLMRFVPYVGTPIAALPPIALAAAVDPGWSMALWTAAFYLVGEALMGHVVEPVAFGQSTGLSPFSVVVAAIFWTWLWGAVGLLLATPLTVCLVVLGRHVERLQFFGVMLADRPALAPAESFYQRMLAGDPDEAEDQAEQILKERPLTAYYDEVAVAGLRLAAADAARGALAGPRLGTVREATRDLVEALADHEDADPPEPAMPAAEAAEGEEAPPARPPVAGSAPAGDGLAPGWRAEAPVLCVAGRGPFDEAVAAMLAQLLGKHGLGARVAPREAVSRAGLRSVDLGGVAMVCVCYLEIGGSPAHLRRLLRRLRQQAPQAPLLAGLWPADDPVLTDRELRAAVGADHYATSLREAVEAGTQEARRAAAAAAPAPVRPDTAGTPTAAVPRESPGSPLPTVAATPAIGPA